MCGAPPSGQLWRKRMSVPETKTGILEKYPKPDFFRACCHGEMSLARFRPPPSHLGILALPYYAFVCSSLHARSPSSPLGLGDPGDPGISNSPSPFPLGMCMTSKRVGLVHWDETIQLCFHRKTKVYALMEGHKQCTKNFKVKQESL